MLAVIITKHSARPRRPIKHLRLVSESEVTSKNISSSILVNHLSLLTHTLPLHVSITVSNNRRHVHKPLQRVQPASHLQPVHRRSSRRLQHGPTCYLHLRRLRVRCDTHQGPAFAMSPVWPSHFAQEEDDKVKSLLWCLTETIH